MRTDYLTRSGRKDNEKNIGIGVLQFSKNIFLLKQQFYYFKQLFAHVRVQTKSEFATCAFNFDLLVKEIVRLT